MSPCARQHVVPAPAFAGSAFLGSAFLRAGRARTASLDRLARRQLWREVPTFLGILAALLGAIFL